MKICIVQPQKFSPKVLKGEVEEMVQAHYSKFSGLADSVEKTPIEEIDINNYDYFFVYHSEDAIKLSQKGCNKFSFFLNEPEASDRQSPEFSTVIEAIKCCHLTVVRSVFWFELFSELQHKIIYLSYGFSKNENLTDIQRNLKVSEIKLLCLGNNDREDNLNYVKINKFAAKFKMNISFVNYGCEFFQNIDHQFFEANSSCQILCDNQNLFNNQKGNVFNDILRSHDILIDLRNENLEGLTSYQLKCLFSGMPCISSIFKNFPDDDCGLINCDNTEESLTDAVQYVISNWRKSVIQSKEFALSRDWYYICEAFYKLITGDKRLTEIVNE